MYTMADRVGQMIMGGFHGLTPPPYLLEWLQEGRLGGVILFSRNVESPTQLAELVASLQAAAKFPLLISIDQEGGTVARLRETFTESPGAMALASGTNDSDGMVQAADAVLGQEMKALGINWTYAPVVDLFYNAQNPSLGTRSFGNDAESVAGYAAAAVRGFQEQGVSACVKHFPGLGNTAIDTHEALPRLKTSLEHLRVIDMMPYRSAVAAGVGSIMTTHTIFEAIDPEYPVPLSEHVIHRLIRDELGFDGVVTSDCMEMKAIDDHYEVAEATVRAARAGVDIILYSHTPEKQAQAYDALLKAVEVGNVPEEVVVRASERVRKLKERFPSQAPQLEDVLQEASLQVMENAARAGITQLRVQEGVLPLSLDAGIGLLVEFSSMVESIVQESVQASDFATIMQKVLPNLQSITLPMNPTSAHQSQIDNIPYDYLIIAVRNAYLDDAQAAFVRQLATQNEHPVILLALRNPHDALLISDGTVLCSAGDSVPSLYAIRDALTGEFTPTGRLPIFTEG